MGDKMREGGREIPLVSQAASSTRPCVPPSASYPPHLPSYDIQLLDIPALRPPTPTLHDIWRLGSCHILIICAFIQASLLLSACVLDAFCKKLTGTLEMRESEPAVTDEVFWHRRAAETEMMRVGASTVLQSLFRVDQADLDSLKF